MKRGVIALTVIALVIISAAAGYSVGTSTRSATTTSTSMPITLPSSVCTTPVPRFNETGATQVYQIAPQSIGVICVRYEFEGNGSASFSPTDFGPATGSSGSSWAACGSQKGGTLALACSGLSITPSQPSINHLTSQNITVAYTVRTETSVPGVFWFFIGSCDAIALAIGENTAAVGGPPGFGCVATPGAPTSVTAVGTWNINVTEASTTGPLP